MTVYVVEWCVCALFAASIASDLYGRRIPNVIPTVLLGLFVVYAFVGAIEPSRVLWAHLATGVALLAAGFVLYLSGRFGAGDGKLLAVAGVWIGPIDLSLYLFGLAAGAFALSLFALLPFSKTRDLRTELPFAVAIAPPAMIIIISRALSHPV